MYYECKRCLHKTKQKVEMIRHLNRKNKCVRNNVESMKYTDTEIFELSTKKNFEKNDNISIDDKDINENSKLICNFCNTTFHNKSNLNRHLNSKKCTEKCTNITNNNTLNQQNNIININFNIVKSFDEDWDVSKIDKTLRDMLVLSNIQYTKTLEHILDNETNLNVVLDDNSDSGIVYKNELERFQPMTVTDIIDKSMDKLHKQLKVFYNDFSDKKDQYVLDEHFLNRVKDLTDKKYSDYKTNKDVNLRVKELITNIYNNKRNETLKMYELLCNNDEKALLEGY
jgi:hypothetical protein